MVEHAAVNRVVVGSSPTSGANFKVLQNPQGKFYVGKTENLGAERQLQSPVHRIADATPREIMERLSRLSFGLICASFSLVFGCVARLFFKSFSRAARRHRGDGQLSPFCFA